MKNEVQRRGRRIIDVRGDGNCFYRALGHSLGVRFSEVRERSLLDIVYNPGDYQNFIANFDNSDNSVHTAEVSILFMLMEEQ